MDGFCIMSKTATTRRMLFPEAATPMARVRGLASSDITSAVSHKSMTPNPLCETKVSHESLTRKKTTLDYHLDTNSRFLAPRKTWKALDPSPFTKRFATCFKNGSGYPTFQPSCVFTLQSGRRQASKHQTSGFLPLHHTTASCENRYIEIVSNLWS